jgi:branched-chain amino acid transport system permease protein
LGILIEVLIYKPLNNKQAPLAIFMISSIGINILFENLIAMIWGNETKILRPGVEKTYAFGPIILNRIQLSQVAVFLFFSTSLLIFLKYHKMGKIIRATADNAALTMVMGADVNRIRLIVFGLGSFLAGISSILIALDVGVDPHVGFNAVLCGAVATIVGGIGIFGGAIVGAFVLGIAQSLVIWQASARWEQAITFVILVFFLLFRPQGLLGQKKRQEEG